MHNTASAPVPCGAGSPFTVVTKTGFGTSGTSFSSTLSGYSTSELDGTLFECFGPAFSRDAKNMVGSSALQILGQYILACCLYSKYITSNSTTLGLGSCMYCSPNRATFSIDDVNSEHNFSNRHRPRIVAALE